MARVKYAGCWLEVDDDGQAVVVEYGAADAGTAPSKYRNQKTEVDGHVFDSKAEARRYGELALLQQGGHIRDLELQPDYLLQPAFTDAVGQRWPKIVYRADFRYVETESGAVVVEEVKGFETDTWRMKQKLMRLRHPNVDLRVLKV